MADRSPADRSIRAVLAPFRSVRRGILATTLLSASAAMLEAVGLVMVVGLTNAIAEGEDRLEQQLGPVTLDLRRSQMVVAALVVILASAGVILVANAIRTRITVLWVRRRRDELVDAFLSSSWQVQTGDRAGRLQAVSQYIDSSANALSSVVLVGRGLSGVLVLIGTAVIVSPIAAVAILVLGGVLFGVLRPLTMRTRKANREVSVLNRRYLEDLGELSALARDVRVFGVADRFSERSGASIEELAVAERRVYALSWALTPVYQAMALCLIVAILAGASASESVELTTIGAVALLVLRSVAYGQQFQSSYHGLQTYASSLELLDAALVELRADRPEPGAVQSDRIDAIDLDHVSFSYPDGTVGLADVSLSFRRGEVVGIVGPSGAGKSTLAQVLLGLRRPDAGTAVADGVPFDEYAPESWTRLVSLVPQEIHLAEGSVLDNIRFFRSYVDPDDVRAAAGSAAIHETIEALEDGYDTNVGRASRNLSGGQVQRIGIARALAGRPSVLVLDEPTSALDNQSEAAVQAALRALHGEVLVLVIAHRLSTLSVCDRIVVMDAGRVEADGSLEHARGTSSFFRAALAHGADGRLDPVDAPGDAPTAPDPTATDPG